MPIHPEWRSIWLVAAALIAGSLNALAGGGSFLSFPALLGAGIAPIQANATNTVALWPGQFTSIAGYFTEIKSHLRLVLPLALAAVTGGLAGALVLLRTGPATFMALLPWLLLFATMLFVLSGPIGRRMQRAAAGDAPERPSLTPMWIGAALVSFYIGYFGAGGGFLLMSIFSTFGVKNIHEVNALKVIVTTAANGTAVIAFILDRQILWRECLLMMVAAAIGGYLGARLFRRLNQRLVRLLVIAVGAGMAGFFFWRQLG